MSDAEEKANIQPDWDKTIPTSNFIPGTVAPGGEVGPYKLLSILGEGGFAVVYLAEQQRPIKRRVALKVIKPGMDSKQVIARFEAERQALALLDHPNIARVFDAGTTENGRPYFVMEYVKGIPITEHCDRHKLTIEQRLELFLQVCEAIQHAHQKGIIHRDIKPSNILVVLHDDKALPKVIDFGVAKAISQPLTQKTLFTEQGQLIGTPEYMSPEQAELTTQDIDTRSDIYSLGVLLYELLTGTLPFDPKTLHEAALDEILRVIRSEDPPKPSTRLLNLGEEATTVAASRRTDIKTLSKRLHKELEWIPLKAMRKERERRYKTASELADDIRNYLKGNLLIAGPESVAYRAKKFIRKHRTKVAVVMLAGVLFAALAVIFVMHIRAVNRSKEAESLKHTSILKEARELRSRGQLKGALAEAEKVLNSESVGPEARLLHAQIILELQGPADALKELEKLLNERGEIAGQAHFLLAKIYYEGDPDAPGRTGTYRQKWEYHREKAEELLPDTADAYLLRAVSTAIVPKALQYIDKALDLDKNHYDSLRVRASLSYISRNYIRMVTDAAQMMAIEPNNPQGYSLCATAERELGQFDAAIEHYNKAIQISPDDTELYAQRWQTYMRMGKYEEALSDAKMCVQLQPKNSPYHYNVFYTLVALGRYDEAQKKYDTITCFDLGRKHILDWSASKYVSDTLAAGHYWYPLAREPKGTAFVAMLEAERIYLKLSQKAKRVVPNGFHATWSPVGSKLAYSYGTVGLSLIAILDLKSNKIDLLTTPGKDPEWSPDGEYIVYVKDRHILPLSYMVTSLEGWHRSDEEVWIVKADGTEEPRFLHKGRWPNWSKDSKRVFFCESDEKNLWLISIDNSAGSTAIIRPTTGVVSPNDAYVAYTQDNKLEIVELSTESVVTNWEAPSAFGYRIFVSWSSDGNSLMLPYYNLWGRWVQDNMGIWLYDWTTRRASKILSGSFEKCSWSRPDMSKIAIGRSYSTLHNEIWIADTADLDNGLTLQEHFQEMVDCCTRRIEADPSDAVNYLSRAKYYAILEEEEKALADLEKCAILNPSRAGQIYFETAWRLVFDSGSQGSPAIAVHLARRAVEKDPNEWYYYMTLGVAQYHSGMYEEAIASLKKAESTYLGRGKRPHQYSFLDTSDKIVNSMTVYYHPNAACIAMTFHKLGRQQEAEVALAALRKMFENGTNRELLKFWIEAEQLFAGEDSKTSVAWDYVGNRRFREALELVADMSVADSNQGPNAVASAKYLRRYLAQDSFNRGLDWEQVEKYSKAIEYYELATKADPNYAFAFNHVARFQATFPDAKFRNSVESIKNATKACELTKWEDGFYIDTLAAAYAESGDFDEATKQQQQAIDLLTKDQRRRYQLEFEARLKLYQSGQPYHRQRLFEKQMIAWWAFDQIKDKNVLDSSGNNLHGELVGDAKILSDPQKGNVLSLDGNGDYVDCGNSSIYDITSEITVAAWIKLSGKADDQKVAGNQDYNAGGYKMSVHTNKVDFEIRDQSNVPTLNRNLAGGTILQPGVWYHVVGVYSQGNYIRTYVNGNLDRELVTAAVLANTSGTLKIGREPYDSRGDFFGFNGLIDDVRIYNYALSEAEVKALYEGKDPPIKKE